MRKVLLDTDVIIDFLRGKTGSRNYLASLINEADVCCSALSVAEIHAGMKEHEREPTMELLDSLAIVDVDRKIAEKAGQYKRGTKSQTLELDDCIIAATAFTIHAVLATSNSRHYPMKDIDKEIVPAD